MSIDANDAYRLWNTVVSHMHDHEREEAAEKFLAVMVDQLEIDPREIVERFKSDASMRMALSEFAEYNLEDDDEIEEEDDDGWIMHHEEDDDWD